MFRTAGTVDNELHKIFSPKNTLSSPQRLDVLYLVVNHRMEPRIKASLKATQGIFYFKGDSVQGCMVDKKTVLWNRAKLSSLIRSFEEEQYASVYFMIERLFSHFADSVVLRKLIAFPIKKNPPPLLNRSKRTVVAGGAVLSLLEYLCDAQIQSARPVFAHRLAGAVDGDDRLTG